MSQPLPEPTNVGPIANGNLRASDADRDQVATLLSTAYAEGRLTREEHGQDVSHWIDVYRRYYGFYFSNAYAVDPSLYAWCLRQLSR